MLCHENALVVDFRRTRFEYGLVIWYAVAYTDVGRERAYRMLLMPRCR